MAATYPTDLPLPMIGHTREQGAAFQAAQPMRGWAHVEPIGEDMVVSWGLTWRLSSAQAVTFREWVRDDLEGGSLPFDMEIRTEFGLVSHELQLMPESLLPARHLGGEVWEYTATAAARALLEP